MKRPDMDYLLKLKAALYRLRFYKTRSIIDAFAYSFSSEEKVDEEQ